MDWALSPHREAGSILYLPSPTHAHSYHVDAFQKIRRSLSRSPSKGTRFQLTTSKSPNGTPSSPLSPLAVARAVSPAFARDQSTHPAPPSPLASHAALSTKSKKLALRRVAPFRATPRTSTTPRSPVRRALSDNSSQANKTPCVSRRSSGDENVCPSATPAFKQEPDVKTPALRFELNDGPIKFEFCRQKQDSPGTPGERLHFPAKSSPLKRVDGRVGSDPSNFGSPAKRRSLLGVTLGADFDVFAQDAMSVNRSETSASGDFDTDTANASFSGTNPKRTLSLRKSTLQQQRHAPRARLAADSQLDSSTCASPAQKSRNRISLDGSSFAGQSMQSPFLRTQHQAPLQPNFLQRQPPLRQPSQQPHPLSNALTASSSASALTEDMCTDTLAPPAPPPAPTRPLRFHPSLAKSLPIGSSRPDYHLYDPDSQTSSHDSFATPTSFKNAKPNPAAFMSTGLISKKNRNIEAAGEFASYAMPGTPSKRNSFPPVSSTPLNNMGIRKLPRPSLEFGTPSTPFASPSIFAKSTSNLFAIPFADHALLRRSSFLSIDGEDHSQSPTGNPDSQSSADDLPPTPTKPAGKNGKESSLRSSLFGRRTSLGPDTFVPPSAAGRDSAKDAVKTFAIDVPDVSGRVSPHTPHDNFTPPDPSGLSISAGRLEFSFPCFNSSTNSNSTFPPATPTAPREHMFPFGNSTTSPFAAVTANDVDICLTSRFGRVTAMAGGEFSQVFRVEEPLNDGSSDSPRSATASTRVFAVKKSKRAYTGYRDQERKRKEVEILRALCGKDHIIEFFSSWENTGHLYIQTEFCENGNLYDFLKRVGNKARLDDFRIWKILLELSLGIKHIHESGFIHLDLKPSNVFIDYEGVLKIGDFGLASSWPAPRNIDGEGDRFYIAPEVLVGTYDKPGDIFSLGLIIAEIAANVELPDGGSSWQKLRHGDLGEFPSLTFSSDSSLPRNESGDPISPRTSFFDESDDELDKSGQTLGPPRQVGELLTPPSFMVDPEDDQALDRVVCWMVAESAKDRPTIDQVYRLEGVQWIEARRRSGAIIYEGYWGPSDEVLSQALEQERDVDMTDV